MQIPSRILLWQLSRTTTISPTHPLPPLLRLPLRCRRLLWWHPGRHRCLIIGVSHQHRHQHRRLRTTTTTATTTTGYRGKWSMRMCLTGEIPPSTVASHPTPGNPYTLPSTDPPSIPDNNIYPIHCISLTAGHNIYAYPSLSSHLIDHLSLLSLLSPPGVCFARQQVRVLPRPPYPHQRLYSHPTTTTTSSNNHHNHRLYSCPLLLLLLLLLPHPPLLLLLLLLHQLA